MKKVLAMAAVLLFVSVTARAAYYEATVTTATGAVTTTSAQIPVAGYLDRVEVIQTAGVTNTITLATFDGSTAIDTYISLASLATATKVVRPRVIGTTTAGVDIAAAVQAGSDAVTNNVGTALIAAYERPLVGGNLKFTVLGNAANVVASDVTLRIYYQRFDR